LVDTQYGYVLSPMEQGIRLTTGVEFALPGTPPTPVQISQTLPRAQELLPLGPAVEPKAWLGNRPCFADSLPIIDAAPRHKNLWLNFGHGHLGMTIGPASGKILAQLMITGDRSHMSPYRADRFS
jgi:D-amino-acid dehydrogenase